MAKRRDGMSKEPMRVKSYNRAYYDEHGRELTEKKKERYRNDPEYRAQCIQRARQQRMIDKNLRRGRVIRILNGRRVLVYKLGRLCEYLGISPYQVTSWEAMGLLPKPLFEGVRVYTDNQLTLIGIARDAMEEHRTVEKAKEAVGDVIKFKWEKM